MFASFGLADADAQLIDSTMPTGTDLNAPFVSQTSPVGTVTPLPANVAFVPLPDPTVGGVNGGGTIGYSTGFKSWASRWQAFTGRVLGFAPIINPVQGQVGLTNRANRLRSGVLNQLVQYTASMPDYAASFVGITGNGSTVNMPTNGTAAN